MKVAVVGAGAMGCLFGAFLARAGADVRLLDHTPAVVEVLRRRGIRLRAADGETVVPVGAAALRPEELGTADWVLVAVKAHQTRSALGSLPPLLGPETPVLTLQNGLGAADEIAAAVGAGRTLVGATAQGATLLAPGEVRHGGRGETVLGPYRGPLGQAPAVAEALSRAGLPARAVADPGPHLWRKLAVNCGINALAALTGVLNGRIPEIPEAAALLTEAVAEAAAVARAVGVDLGDPASLARSVLGVAAATGANRASMGQDVDRRTPTEIDWINGAVVREGERLGVPTPVNRTLARLVKTLEAGFPRPDP